MRLSSLLLLLLCSGCALLSDYRRQHFDVDAANRVALRVPRGFVNKQASTDSAGHHTLTFRYPFGGYLFVTNDTMLAQYIDTAVHLAKPHIHGGRFYKGVMPNLQVWREVYSQKLRYGYGNVGLETEPLFDSSLNFIRYR